MIRNQSNFAIDTNKTNQIIGNPEFMNPFQSGLNRPKQQYRSPAKSALYNQKSPFEPTSSRKSNKIKQAKQLLAQRLKQVTNIQFQEQQNNPNKKMNHQINENKKDHPQNWDFHMNPISKLTKQPFVRSKTCDELRKQHSLKKQRKRNHSANKYSSPQINECERDVRSTGLYSKQVQSGWVQNSEQNRTYPKSGKVETKQFALDPFGNNMIETFDEDQIKKLSNDVAKKKLKGKYTSGKKASVELKQETTVISEIKYPFRINSAFHQESKSPNKFEDSRNSSLSNLLINDFNHLGSSKFTPRLQRYHAFEKKQTQLTSPHQNINFQRIQIKENQAQDSQNQRQDKQHSFEYSEDQRQQDRYNSAQVNTGMRSGVRSSYNQNELVANLHLTNTILEEKLRIKQIEMQELNRNYFKLKTELLQTKNIPNQNIRYPQNHHLTIQTVSLNHQQYLNNIEPQSNTLGQRQIALSQFVNQSNEIQSLASPKFCDGIQEEFARQRYVRPPVTQFPPIFQQKGAFFTSPTHVHSKFAKKKQLFSSDMSQKISEEFDSQEIYMPTHFEQENSNLSRKYVFKKSNFNQNGSVLQEQNLKRDSYVYTLGEEPQSQGSSKKNIQILSDSSSRPVSGNAMSEEMLLEPITQSINSSSEKIDLLSPIKSHSTQKIDNSSFRHSFRTSLTKSENRILDDSMRKFEYYLTPQKDENILTKSDDPDEKEGLFEKAFSSLKKKRDSEESSGQKVSEQASSSYNKESRRYSGSSSKKQQPIDPIIEHAIE